MKGGGGGHSNGVSDTDQSRPNGSNNGVYMYHPEVGPLPLNVPNTVISTTVLRVPQDQHDNHQMPPSQFIVHPHQRHSSSSSPSQFHGHSPCSQSPGFFFSPQGDTPTAQFSSPPPPPYSPLIHYPPSLDSSSPFNDSRGQRHFDGGRVVGGASMCSPQSHDGYHGTSPVFTPQTVSSPWGERLDGVVTGSTRPTTNSSMIIMHFTTISLSLYFFSPCYVAFLGFLPKSCSVCMYCICCIAHNFVVLVTFGNFCDKVLHCSQNLC